MQLISKLLIKKLGFHYVSFIFLVNMHRLFLYKIKKGLTIVNTFQKILGNSTRKPHKIWVDQGSGFSLVLLQNG